VTEALSSSCPPEKEAVAAIPKAVPPRAQSQLARTVPGRLAPRYQITLPSHTPVLRMNAAVTRNESNRSAKDSRCSFCRAELTERLELSIPGSGTHGQRASTGCFCSMHCRNCVLALAALHPSPLASDDFISARTLLTDGLLELWRQGQGPDPELVLQAANRAGCGLQIADPAVSVEAGRWLLSEPA
jgi:hypothetical protein